MFPCRIFTVLILIGLRNVQRLPIVLFFRILLLCYHIDMTRVFDLQELDRVEFLTMFCSNSKGGLLNFRATIRDGKDILCIHVDKAESVDLGTVSSEFRQFIYYLSAYVYSDSYNIADLNNCASDSLF